MSTEFADLPNHMQVIVAGSVMIVGSAWGVIKFIKPFIDNLTPKNPGTATDAVVVSASLADSRIMGELKSSIDRLNETQEKSNILMTMIYEALVKVIMKLS